MHPLTQQLISQYYTIDGMEGSMTECSIKEIILNGLTEKYFNWIESFRLEIGNVFFCSILNNWFLTVAAFLDPRFQIFQNPTDVQRIKEELTNTCNIKEIAASPSAAKANAAIKEKPQMLARKSGKPLSLSRSEQQIWYAFLIRWNHFSIISCRLVVVFQHR